MRASINNCFKRKSKKDNEGKAKDDLVEDVRNVNRAAPRKSTIHKTKTQSIVI